jgi:TATA-box binding protein (TBP) (component of TFIID and TFIIIB)
MEGIIKDIYDNSDNLMENLFKNYNDNKKDIFNVKSINSNLSLKNDIVMDIVFAKLKIVTITLNLQLNIDLKFDVLIEKFVEMYHMEDSKLDVIYLKYLDAERNLQILGNKKKKITTQFYNSFTTRIVINENTLTIKFFKNGSLHITGCKDTNDVKILLRLLIDYFKENKDLLMEKNKIDIGFLEKKKILELKQIATELGIELVKKIKKNELITEISKTDYLLKIFTGKNYIRDTIDDIVIEDIKINVSMINNSYTIYNKVNDELKNFEIDRRKLYNYIKDNTELSCYYDNNSHQGVKIYFMYNKSRTGVCKCEKNCILNSKNTTCKKITILIFNSAKIIITGATKKNHSKTAYEYINNIIEENYNEFIQLQIV